METNPFTEIYQQLNEIKLQNQQILTAIGSQQINVEQTRFIDTLPDRLRSRDVKRLFNISNVTIWQWTKKGLLKPQVISGRNYYAKVDILKLINEKANPIAKKK